ncbi:formate--tetrahydrofolate ligase, partial [Effusibacillus lacus]
SAVVVVATIRALKLHGGAGKDRLNEENKEALSKGFRNLEKHLDTVSKFGLPYVVALNRFQSDLDLEVQLFGRLCTDRNIPFAETDVWRQGGEGAVELANKVVQLAESGGKFELLYDQTLPIDEKIEIIAREVYGADGVQFTPEARKQIAICVQHGWDQLPICVAKTQYSLSDNPQLIGRPHSFTITVREIRPKLGAGFLVALTGDILTMPGLPKRPAALNMDIDPYGNITGLF